MPEDKKETPKISLAQELGVVTVPVTDRHGKVWECPPLDLEDMADLERILGPVGEWLFRGLTLQVMRGILWASMRKVGKTPKEIEDRKFVLTPADLGKMFTAAFARDIGIVSMRILEESGFKTQATKKEASDPKVKSGEAESTGDDSSVAPSPVDIPLEV